MEGPVSRLRIKTQSPGMWELDDILFSGERVPLGRSQAPVLSPASHPHAEVLRAGYAGLLVAAHLGEEHIFIF